MEEGIVMCIPDDTYMKRGLTNQDIALKTTLINTCWAIEEWEREPMLGVSMKTYIRAVDTKKEREAQLIDRVHANMSQWEGVQKKKKLSEPWCECNFNGENL